MTVGVAEASAGTSLLLGAFCMTGALIAAAAATVAVTRSWKDSILDGQGLRPWVDRSSRSFVWVCDHLSDVSSIFWLEVMIDKCVLIAAPSRRANSSRYALRELLPRSVIVRSEVKLDADEMVKATRAGGRCSK